MYTRSAEGKSLMKKRFICIEMIPVNPGRNDPLAEENTLSSVNGQQATTNGGIHHGEIRPQPTPFDFHSRHNDRNQPLLLSFAASPGANRPNLSSYQRILLLRYTLSSHTIPFFKTPFLKMKSRAYHPWEFSV